MYQIRLSCQVAPPSRRVDLREVALRCIAILESLYRTELPSAAVHRFEWESCTYWSFWDSSLNPRSKSLIRLFARSFSAIALAAVLVPAVLVPTAATIAQQHIPPAPTASPAPAPAAQDQAAPAPSAPEPSAPAFPKPDPANFTAAAPAKEVVNAFLEANWGYDETRFWQVQAILKTPVDGLSKVIVLFGDKTGKEKPQALAFFALPDGRHIITGDQVIDFGVHPFAEVRAQLQQRADGAYRGGAGKDFEMIEFADFQCPVCKAAQANMEKLVADFPKARIVFENFPIPSIHPQSLTAAEYGLCVNKQGGSPAFFQFAAAVFDGQEGLASPDGATLTLNSAVTKAGLEPAKIAACAADPQTKAQVDASVKLGTDVGVGQVPTLFVNGREVPANAPYEVLKKIVDFQEKADGINQ
jgi:protein-disulfide isomerase